MFDAGTIASLHNDSIRARDKADKLNRQGGYSPRNAGFAAIAHDGNLTTCLLNNAMVYVRGDLADLVMKAATKAYIAELTAEIKRLLPNSRRM